ncbi:MAG: hypothetical protein HYR91_11275 [Flavobacteriia bacterium]|nr:hypothetical protein [Flavobacteriia bacterium]
MLSSKNKIILVIGFIGLIFLLLWFLEGHNSEVNKTVFHSENWNRKYLTQDKDPYGLYVFNSLLKTHVDDNHRVHSIYKWKDHDSLLKKNEKATYIFIGNNLELLDSEIDTLLSEVNEGADLMLSFYDLTSNIYNRLFNYVGFDYDYADSVIVYTEKDQMTMFQVYQKDTLAMKWEGFDPLAIKDTLFDTLSSFMEMPNFIRINRGKGHIFLHANPQFYMNYQVLRNDGFEYAAFTINEFSVQKNVYWLEIGRKKEIVYSNNTNSADSTLNGNGKNNKRDDSLLQLLFKNQALRWALLLTLFGFILFLVFRSKRYNPVIPILPKNRNVTTAYAETITSIYFQNHSPYGLLKVQRKNFYHAILKHFYIDLTKRNEDKEIILLSEKSNVPIDELKAILQLIETKDSFDVNEQYIAKVSKIQRDFYLQTGIISNFILNRIEQKDQIYKRILWMPSVLLLTGILIFIVGFYFLVQANGLGILFWPLGIFFITIAILQLKKPIVAIKNQQLIFYSIFKRKEVYNLDAIINIISTNSSITFEFVNQQKIQINYWEMSRFDRYHFASRMSNFHK